MRAIHRFPQSIAKRHGGPSRRAARCPAADGLDGEIAQFAQRQILYDAPVFVIEDQAALAIDLHAAGHPLVDFSVAVKSESHHQCHAGSRGPCTVEGGAGGTPAARSIGSCFLITSASQFKSFLMIEYTNNLNTF
jgi:hypothetical protein